MALMGSADSTNNLYMRTFKPFTEAIFDKSTTLKIVAVIFFNFIEEIIFKKHKLQGGIERRVSQLLSVIVIVYITLRN